MGAFFTAFYSTRLLYLAFLARPTGHKKIITFASDSNIQICVALSSLAIPSIFVGYYTKDMMVGVGTHFFGTAIFTSVKSYNIFDAEFIPVFYKTLPVHFSLFGALLAFVLYNFQSKLLYSLKISFLGKILYNFLNRKWFFDKVYNEYFGQFFFKFSYSLSYKFVDRGIFEILGPTGLSLAATSIGSKIHHLQTGSLYHLTLTILIGFTLLFGLRQLTELVVSYINPFWSDFKLVVLIFILFIFSISYSESSDNE